MKKFVLVALLFLAGCVAQYPTTGVERLLTDFPPLTKLVEKAENDGKHTLLETLTPLVYVQDMDIFDMLYPEGSIHYTALMLHEQEHAKRQESDGLSWWVFKYNLIPGCKWKEEKAGMEKEIAHLLQNGVSIDEGSMVKFLMDYDMASRDEITTWVRSMIKKYTIE